MAKILLVEDDLALSMGIEYALNSAGFNIKTAKKIKEAKDKLEKDKFDLILLDVMLPDGNGYDLCKDIRAKDDTPIIFLTACDEEANIILGLDLGGDDYLTKPVRIGELISRINAVLRRKFKGNDKDTKVLVSGDIKVELLKYRVSKKDREIVFTSIEYKLLLMLMENSGHVLLRNVILDKLWDANGDFIDDNTLSVYIKRIREKLEDDIKNPKYIVTMRELGYKWNEALKGHIS